MIVLLFCRGIVERPVFNYGSAYGTASAKAMEHGLRWLSLELRSALLASGDDGIFKALNHFEFEEALGSYSEAKAANLFAHENRRRHSSWPRAESRSSRRVACGCGERGKGQVNDACIRPAFLPGTVWKLGKNTQNSSRPTGVAMKSILVSLLIAALACSPGSLEQDLAGVDYPPANSAPPQLSTNLEDEVARIDDERRNAYLQNDAGALDRILADDVTAVAGIGSEDDKASILADVRSHDLTYKKLTYDHRKIRIYGDTAVVTSQAEIIANYKERDLSGKLLVTRVYAKQQGNWKLVAIQSTRIPPSVNVAAQDTTYQATAEVTSKVVFVPAKQLASEIHKAPERRPSISWIDFTDTPKYLASVIRRTAPDRAEIHKRMTDLWYVIEGGGVLVTGGSLTNANQTEPDELRGRSISGGEGRQIGKGDFVKIPAGVPHWVRKIDGKELVYLVVKVASPE